MLFLAREIGDDSGRWLLKNDDERSNPLAIESGWRTHPVPVTVLLSGILATISFSLVPNSSHCRQYCSLPRCHAEDIRYLEDNTPFDG